MLSNGSKDERNMAPRWRSVGRTAIAGELSSISGTKRPVKRKASESDSARLKLVEIQYASRVEHWRRDPCLATAEELTAAAVVLGRSNEDEVQRAADLLSARPGRLRGPAMVLGLLNGGSLMRTPEIPQSVEAIHREIAARKARIRLAPRDSLLLADTARLYLMVAQEEKARHLVWQASFLSPGNRYVMRSGTRFFLHVGDTGAAYEFAKRHHSNCEDPWQLAAMLASARAAGKIEGELKQARRMVMDQRFAAFDLSELAATVATAEMQAGSRKLARQFFRQSLLQPTENVVAQVEWAHTKDISIVAPAMRLPSAHEAMALNAYYSQRWAESLDHISAWGMQEPFDPAPRMMGSFVAICMLREYRRGMAIAEEGKRANPNNATLLNNLAVAEAYLGNCDAAETYLVAARMHANTEEERRVILVATEGLIAVRRGDLEGGIKLYCKAIEAAIDRKSYPHWGLAMLHMAREVAPFWSNDAMQLVDTVQQITDLRRQRNLPLRPEILSMLNEVREMSRSRVPQVLNQTWSASLSLPPTVLLN